MGRSLSMKKDNLVLGFLGLASVVATFIALTSSSGCILYAFEQPKLPKSLLKTE